MDAFRDLYNCSGLNVINQDEDYKIEVKLNPDKWTNKRHLKTLNEVDWKMVKYHNSSGNESAEFKRIPSTIGGVFMWVIKPSLVPINNLSIIAYVGSSERNIQNSVLQFIRSGASRYTGRLINNLFQTYADCLYLVYYENSVVAESKAISNELIDATEPPIRIISGTLFSREEMK